MKERGILFNAPMVRATREGRKTQTRLVVKLPHENSLGCWEPTTIGGPDGGRCRNGDTIPLQGAIWHTRTGDMLACQYGQPGDRLWGRESGWERPERTLKMMRDGADMWEPYYFDADGYTDLEHDQFKEWGFKRRPSIHMPRWASRILLEIVSVRVERLNDISEADARAEGVPAHDTARAAYANLWNDINGAGSWDANPWVWVIDFELVKP